MKQETIDRIRKFTSDRDWEQYHTPANLAKSISIEANELLECFQWSDTDYDLQQVKDELADVIVYCRNMLDELGLDEDEIVNEKMTKNEAKYPVELAKGSAQKYTNFHSPFEKKVYYTIDGEYYHESKDCPVLQQSGHIYSAYTDELSGMTQCEQCAEK